MDIIKGLPSGKGEQGEQDGAGKVMSHEVVMEESGYSLTPRSLWRVNYAKGWLHFDARELGLQFPCEPAIGWEVGWPGFPRAGVFCLAEGSSLGKRDSREGASAGTSRQHSRGSLVNRVWAGHAPCLPRL